MEDIHDVCFKHLPASLEKLMIKPSRPGALSLFRAFTTSKTLLSSRGLVTELLGKQAVVELHNVFSDP
jgi:hypothetical protein